MFFSSSTNLFRNSLTRTAALALAFGCSTMTVVAGPGVDKAASTKTSASEYEEWGLTPPKNLSGKSTRKETPAEPPRDENFDEMVDRIDAELQAEERAKQPAPQVAPPVAQPETAAGTVPADLAASIDQAMVYIYLTDKTGRKYKTVGWLVDAQRGIVMTQEHMLDGAVTIVVAFPQITGLPQGEFRGSVAGIMKYDTTQDIAYLKIHNMPKEPLVSLGLSSAGGNGYPVASQRPQDLPVENQRPFPNRPAPTPPTPVMQNADKGFRPNTPPTPAPRNQQLAGRWTLQHQENGAQVYIEAYFSNQGQYSMQIVTVDAQGNRANDVEQGAYTVQNNNLQLQTSDGPLVLPFWFENGMLFVNYTEQDITFCFQRS